MNLMGITGMMESAKRERFLSMKAGAFLSLYANASGGKKMTRIRKLSVKNVRIPLFISSLPVKNSEERMSEV